MKYLLNEKRNRFGFYWQESVRIVLKSISQNIYLEKPTKLTTLLKLSTLINNFIKIRLVNRCIITDRRNRYNLFYKFSRLIFLKLGRNNDLVGLKRHNW